MFGLFLLPLPVRNTPLAYEWVLYRAAHKLGRMILIGEEAYVADYAARRAANVWATRPETCAWGEYELPDTLDGIELHALRPDTLASLAGQSLSPNQTWTRTIVERLPDLEEAIVRRMATIDPRLEALLLWTNCPSAQAAARALGIPTIHNELGPLRRPEYRATAYFDLVGVNGNTSANIRWSAFAAERASVPILSRTELLELLRNHPVPQPGERRHEAGVALQVGVDSNLLAFGRGYSNIDAIYTALRFHADVLVRPHPAMPERQGGLGVTWDDRESATDFLVSIDRLYTINSSLALEAMLLDVPVVLLGDSPFALGGMDPVSGATALTDEARLVWLNWMVFGYLIPYARVFDAEYYRWRLAGQSESEIYRNNLAYWRKSRGQQG